MKFADLYRVGARRQTRRTVDERATDVIERLDLLERLRTSADKAECFTKH